MHPLVVIILVCAVVGSLALVIWGIGVMSETGMERFGKGLVLVCLGVSLLCAGVLLYQGASVLDDLPDTPKIETY